MIHKSLSGAQELQYLKVNTLSELSMLLRLFSINDWTLWYTLISPYDNHIYLSWILLRINLSYIPNLYSVQNVCLTQARNKWFFIKLQALGIQLCCIFYYKSSISREDDHSKTIWNIRTIWFKLKEGQKETQFNNQLTIPLAVQIIVSKITKFLSSKKF